MLYKGDIMKINKILVVAFISISCYANESWSNKDKILEGVFVTSIVMDWDQTSQIHKENRHEINSILGPHPEQSTINTYFISSALLHIIIADQLYDKYRTAWQAIWIGAEVTTVQRNYKLGIRFNF